MEARLVFLFFFGPGSVHFQIAVSELAYLSCACSRSTRLDRHQLILGEPPRSSDSTAMDRAHHVSCELAEHSADGSLHRLRGRGRGNGDAGSWQTCGERREGRYCSHASARATEPITELAALEGFKLSTEAFIGLWRVRDDAFNHLYAFS